MQVIVTVKAMTDLVDIGQYIAQNNPAAADVLIDRLQRECKLLATVPLRYPLVEGYEQRGIRKRPVGNYLIFYRVGARVIDVLHIVHHARDHAPLLSGDPS